MSQRDSQLVALPLLPADRSAAVGRAPGTVDWGPLGRVLTFVAGTHLWCGILLIQAGLPLPYFPEDQPAFVLMMLIGVIVVGYVAFGMQVVVDGIRHVRGAGAVPIRVRLSQWFRIMLLLGVFTVVFDAVLLNNSGLKPAIQTINPGWHDPAIEQFERALFGGHLPTEWITRHAGEGFMRLMDRVYGLFGAFMIVSLIFALHQEGTAGGSRLVFAFAWSLTVSLLAALLWPTRGPLFEHPEWFTRFAGLGSGVLAEHLEQTIQAYGAGEGRLRYTVAGIAAMPSYHVAAWTCGMWFWRRLPRWIVILAVVLWLANWLSTVALGWHYLLDGVAGLAVGVLGLWAAQRCIPPAPRTVREAPGA